MSQLTMLDEVNSRISALGLRTLSPFLNGLAVSKAANGRFSQVLLIGSTGSEFWPFFAASTEYNDGENDPLDRWSKNVGDELAAEFDCQVLYPFDGPPFWPFLTWSEMSGESTPSPLGMHIHPEQGLWRAYRFALAFESPVKEGEERTTNCLSPCDSCASQPCLNSCPVDAFTEGGYNVAACAAFLQAHPSSQCNLEGCQARRACPVGKAFRYEKPHAQFHMREFLDSQNLATGLDER